MVLNKIKKLFSSSGSGEDGEEYLEIDLEQQEKENKILVKLFVLRQYDDVNEILNALREGYTIAIIDVKILRQKDSMELKRAISKIKKTAYALEGDIKGLGENTIIVTPSFAKVHRELSKPEEKKVSKFDY